MTVEEMTDQLESLGLEVIDSRGYEINSYCAAHEERTGHIDHNPSWWINADSGAFICFSCGWKGNIYSLVKYITGVGFEFEPNIDPARLSARLNKLLTEAPAVVEDVVSVSESMLSAFTQVPEVALRARGITATASSAHGLLWDSRNNNWVIPIRNEHGKLLGWQEKGFDRRYFKNVPTGIKKSTSLFGYELYSSGDMIVVESPLDVVRLTSLGFLGSVATFGSIISKDQFNLLRGAYRLIFAMDNDEAGKKSTLTIVEMCKEMSVEAWFFSYNHTDMKDIGGMSKDEVVLGLANARHLVRGEKVIA